MNPGGAKDGPCKIPSRKNSISRPKARTSGVVIPNQPRWHQRLVAVFLHGLEFFLTLTLRVKWDDRSGLFAEGVPPGPVIFCVWHNRLALSMWIYRTGPRRHQPGRRMAALVSASKDGAFLAAVLESFKVHPVRGSSSRRGSQALLELTSWAEQGYDLAITPDGPRGPCYKIQDGVLAIAQLTGLPIVPVSFHADRKWVLKSWDAFQIPKPFTRCEVKVGEPLNIPREAAESDREHWRMLLTKRMHEITSD